MEPLLAKPWLAVAVASPLPQQVVGRLMVEVLGAAGQLWEPPEHKATVRTVLVHLGHQQQMRMG